MEGNRQGTKSEITEGGRQGTKSEITEGGKQGAESEIMKKEHEDRANTDENGNITTENLLNSYVIVIDNNQPYPGLVLDIDSEEIYVRCMHRVGKDMNTHQFYWPKCVVDECWYGMDDVVCKICENGLERESGDKI